MARPPLEVADIIAALTTASAEVPGLVASVAQRRVLNALRACRTARLGGHVEQCDRCAHRTIAYNSCRNRHCPKCQARARAEWFEARRQDLLSVAYFHVVFTVPGELAPLALQNKKVLYAILFRAASDTLLQIAADAKHLGAKIGFLAILHTWGQTLMHHPHLHCVVPGGGLSPDGTRWISSRRSYFLPVTVLSRVFRGKFLDYLAKAHQDGKLSCTNTLTPFADPSAFHRLVADVRRKPWVVYAKAPMAGPEHVLKYLARYTHRVAIANSRLLSLDGGTVRFRYTDYQAGTPSVMALDAVEFLRRFLLHVLPDRFVRIRHYGLLANRCRRDNVARCRALIQGGTEHDTGADRAATVTEEHATRSCPLCRVGTMITVDTFTAAQAAIVIPAPLDSS
jgi:hypothetical protein